MLYFLALEQLAEVWEATCDDLERNVSLATIYEGMWTDADVELDVAVQHQVCRVSIAIGDIRNRCSPQD